MDSNKLKKIAIWAVIFLLVAPFIPKFLPKAVTFSRAKAAFEQNGLYVTEYTVAEFPGLEAIAQVSMYVDTVRVEIYQYGGEGKIAKHMGYQQKDPGSAIVETWGLAQSLGAAPSRNTPYLAVRNGKFMLIVTGHDEALLRRVENIFKYL